MPFKNFWYPKFEKGRTYIIAEGGINSFGDLECARRIIDVAYTTGCNAIKWQFKTPELCVPEDQKNVIKETPDGPMTYLDYKKLTEFTLDDVEKLFEISRGRIDQSFSVWDIKALRDLTGAFTKDLPWLKLPSCKITDEELCISAFSWGSSNNKRVIASTGMSTEEEVDQLVRWAQWSMGHSYHDLLVLLHCNSAYPCKTSELNLNRIQRLKNRYDLDNVGWSNHSTRIIPTIASIYKGATYIEFHLHLSKDCYGSDSASSYEPNGAFNLVTGVRMLEEAEGDGNARVWDSELPFKKKLRG